MAKVTSDGQVSISDVAAISPVPLIFNTNVSLDTLEDTYMTGGGHAGTAAPDHSQVWVPNQVNLTSPGTPIPNKTWVYSGAPGASPWRPTKLSEMRGAYTGMPNIVVVGMTTGTPRTSWPTTPTSGEGTLTLSACHTGALPSGSKPNYWVFAESANMDAGTGTTWNQWVACNGSNTITYNIKDGGNINTTATARFYVQDLSGCGSLKEFYLDYSYP